MEKANEAVVVLAKCGSNHKIYGMRTEKVGVDQWLFTWAFPIKESSAKREQYDKTTVNGSIGFSDEYPGCPYCGGRNITVCSCGHIGCTIIKNGIYTCEWCGSQGEIGDYSGEDIVGGVDV